MISLLSPLGLLEENILPSSNTGPEDDWLPGSNPWVFDSASNPILQPPDLLEWILGDPAVVQLGGKIHMFANEVFCGLLKSGEISEKVFHGILHFTAPLDSPTNFTKHDTVFTVLWESQIN